jgi:hypothetical protein
MIPQQFYYMRGIRDSENRITVSSSIKRALPILWCRGGEYRLIPKEVVQNAINSVKFYNKMMNKATRSPVVCIYWNQGIPVTNQVGRILTGGE